MKSRDVDGEGMITDPLASYPAYVKAMELYDRVVADTDLMAKDFRCREIVCQIIASAGSVGACFEEGYGRGTTPARGGRRDRASCINHQGAAASPWRELGL